MHIKVYWSTWALFLLIVLLLFATESLSLLTGVVFGFIASGLIFMGMMGVLPIMVAQPAAPKPAKAESVATQTMPESPANAVSILESA
ncbi:MAG: hypothetical protein ABI857_01435 [Acidobacteriota bacterium]